jgi:hypothetical protein
MGASGLTLTGLSLSQVLMVLGGFGVGAVILYLLKLRRRQVEVPFVRLWEEILAEKQTTRLFSQLKRWLSLLLALFIIAILAFALGDPRYQGATETGRSLLVLVDASASMSATDVEPSRFEAAEAELRRLIDGLGPADRLQIAQLDETATPLSPLTSDARVLRDATESLSTTHLRANLRPGLHLALDVLRNQPRAEVVVLTDGGLEASDTMAAELREAEIRLSWVRIGRADANVGLSAFAVRRYPLDKSQSEVLVELWNPTDEARQVELQLIGDGEPVDIQTLSLGPEERLRRTFRNVSGVDRTLEARLVTREGLDHLDADDHAYARLPERRRARVLLVSRGNLYLQAALVLDEYLDVVEVTPDAYPPEGRFDVVLFDAWVPPSPPDTAALYLYPRPEEGVTGPFVIEGEVEAPTIERVERRHPLVRWTALTDVNIASALQVALEREDRVVAGTDALPLIVEGRRNGQRFVALNFDPRRSDLVLRVAWPLFLLNTIDWFVQEDARYVSSYYTGETWHIPVPAGATQATLVGPDQREYVVPVSEGRALFAGAHAGIYTIRTEGAEGAVSEDSFAVNLGASAETRIAPAEALSVGATTAGQVTPGEVGVRRELWLYMLAAVLLILGVEWFTYHRRYTV